MLLSLRWGNTPRVFSVGFSAVRKLETDLDWSLEITTQSVFNPAPRPRMRWVSRWVDVFCCWTGLCCVCPAARATECLWEVSQVACGLPEPIGIKRRTRAVSGNTGWIVVKWWYPVKARNTGIDLNHEPCLTLRKHRGPITLMLHISHPSCTLRRSIILLDISLA
ncbi:hypothetical protein BJ322DRAFT_162577 [Thelephora terrestris]|uniref:Uncharacterized protein n=1 Tax=Thelephora terrestris TaxID=56493 RepID=A0A9P6HCV1_9AGAM|nr:hypothetical protein BJ322DRAFT_162577 [Thelephora terrestris]